MESLWDVFSLTMLVSAAGGASFLIYSDRFEKHNVLILLR